MNENVRSEARSYALLWYMEAHPDAPLSEGSAYADNEWRRYLRMVGMTPKEAAAALARPRNDPNHDT